MVAARTPEQQRHAHDISTFLTDEYFIGDMHVWPEVRAELQAIELARVREVALPWGIGAGKSTLGGILFAYYAHKILPSVASGAFFRRFGLAGNKPVFFFQLATREAQARDNIFAETKGVIDNSPWFQTHYPPADYKHKLVFTHKGRELPLVIQPLSSSQRGPLAYDCYCCAIDEAGWFVESEGKLGDSAEELYNRIKARMVSRFRADGLLLNLSAPRYTGDFVQRRAREIEEGKDSNAYTSRRATWETKPELRAEIAAGECFESPHPQTGKLVKVPNTLAEHFARNPGLSWRDFGGLPSLALEAFAPTAAQFLSSCATLEHLPAPDPASTYFVHGDLALTSDACAVAMSHLRSDGVVQLDRLIIIEKDPATGEVELERVLQQVLRWATQGFGIGQVSFDQFQSADLLQRIAKHGIPTKLVSVDKTTEPYLTLKGRIHEGTFAFWAPHPPMPGAEEIAKFREEYCALELVKGVKIDHSPGKSKDCADAVCGSVSQAVENVGLVWDEGTVTF